MSEHKTESDVTVGQILDVLQGVAPSLATPFAYYDRAAKVEAVQTASSLLLLITSPGKEA